MKKKAKVMLLSVLVSMALVGCGNKTDALAPSRESAIVEVGNLATDTDYTNLDSAEVQKIIDDAKTAIGDAKSQEDIDKAIDAAKSALNNLALAKAKENAKASLDSYVNLDSYGKENKTKIENIISAAKTAIESCTTNDAIDAKVKEAKKSIDEVPTLADERTSGKKELDDYVDLSLYSEENQGTIKGIIADGKTKIDAATSSESIAAIVSEAKKSIDNISTFADEKTTAKKELDDYVDLSLYSEANQEVIKTIIDNAKTGIDAALTSLEISTIVSTAKSAIDEIKTAIEEKKDSAVAEIENYLSDIEDSYSKDNQDEIARIIADAKENIDSATSISVIEQIVEDAKQDLLAVKTIEEEQEDAAQSLIDGITVEDWNSKSPSDGEGPTRDGKNVVVDAKDLNSTRFRFGSQDNNTATVLDTYMTINYRSTQWSSVGIRFRAWDTANSLVMDIKDDSLEFSKSVWDSSKGSAVKTLHTKAASGIKDETKVHLQIISWGWTKKVLIDGECVFSMVENAYNVGKIYLETWQAGITFSTPKYVEYASDADLAKDYQAELDKACVNKTEEELLPERKETAKTTIKEYLNNFDATEVANNKDALDAIISEGNTAIDACGNATEIEEVVTSVKAKIDNVFKTAIEEKNAKALYDAFTVEQWNSSSTIAEGDGPTLSGSDVIIDSKNLDATSICFGSQDGNTATVLDTYMTINYRSTEWSSVGIYFRAWDKANSLIMDIKDGSVTFSKSTWDSTQNCAVKTVHTEGVAGIKDATKVHLQIIGWGWTKKVLIDGECVFSMVENAYNVGKIYLETWQAGITFSTPKYVEYASDADLAKDYQAELDK